MAWALLGAGCAFNGTGGSGRQLTSISVSPNGTSVAKGLTQQFTATGNFSDGTTEPLTTMVAWSSSNPTDATVSSSGLVTAVAVGSANIAATSGGLSGAARVTVGAPNLTGISLMPANPTIALGLTEQFTATGSYTDGSQQNITSIASWSSSNPAVAAVSSGLAKGVGTGNATIGASSGGLNASTVLTVTAATLVSIAVTPATMSIALGNTQQYVAMGTFSDGSMGNVTPSVTWNSSAPGVATISNKPGSNGLATAIGPGTTTISASSSSIIGSAMLTVTAATLTSLAISPTNPSIALGNNQQFTATGTFSDGSMQNVTTSVTWNSSAPGVAAISNSPGSNGLATSTGQGTTTISATASSGPAASTSLTVTAPTLSSIAVTPPNPSISLGSTQQFTATGTFSDGSKQDLTTSASWGSSNASVATISNSPGSNGLASSQGVGTTTISASSGTVSGSTTLTVTSNGTIFVTLSPSRVGLTLSEPQQFQATVTGTSNQNVIWSVDSITGGSSNVGTISTTGLYTPPASAGLHTITATSAVDSTASASGSVAVTDYAGLFTYHNDLARTGQNLQELALTSGNVNQTTFGKLFSCPVDGFVYAQPLYYANLNINGAFHNVVFVATENDTVYAFDADSSSCQKLWQTSFLSPGIVPQPTGDLPSPGCNNLVPQVGITGTPVIDVANNRLYVVAATKDTTVSPPAYLHRLHVLDVTSGAELNGSGVSITATVAGTGVGGVGGSITLDGLTNFSRAALTLVNGQVYVAFGSHCDLQPYHGWLFAYSYNGSQLIQQAVMLDTPNGEGGGIWQGGGALAVDAGNQMYVATGDGTFDANTGGMDYGDTALKLNQVSSSPFSVADYFTPFDQHVQDNNGDDLGGGGVLLLPDQPGANPHLAVLAGKNGSIYLINRDNMGHFNSSSDMIVQELTAALTKNFSTPTYWNGNVYFVGKADFVKQYALTSGLLSSAPVAQSPAVIGYPGDTASVSAASSSASTGLLWVLDDSAYGAGTPPAPPAPAILHAYDASSVGTELYNSTQAAGKRDKADDAVKFTVPTVANGKVYFGTQTALDVYGLLPSSSSSRPADAAAPARAKSASGLAPVAAPAAVPSVPLRRLVQEFNCKGLVYEYWEW